MSRAPRVVDLSPQEVAELLAAGEIRLLDVRQGFEHWMERIAGSELAPLPSFDAEGLAAGAANLVLCCRTGHRSSVAAMRLSRAAGRPVRHLAGGLLAWKGAGRPTVRFRRAVRPG